MSCTICQHPKRQEIDQALAARSATLATLSREYGLSTSSLHRHKAHLQVKMQQAQQRLQNNLFQSFYFWLTRALEMTIETAETAQTEGNFKLLLQSVSQGTPLINLMLKQDFALEDQMVYAILTSPQWAAHSGLLPDDPNIMMKIRESLAAPFSAPCPEEAPPSSASGFPADPARPAPRPVPGTQTKPPLSAGNRKPQTGNCPAKWEKGGKFPGNDCYVFDKEEEYKLLELEKKISQLDFAALTRGLPPAAAIAREEAIMEEIYNSIPLPQDRPLMKYLHEQKFEN